MPVSSQITKAFVVLLGLVHWWDSAGLKITKQAPKGHLMSIVIFPLEKVSDMSSSANIGCPSLGGLHDAIVHFDGEEDGLVLALSLFRCRFDFCFDLITLDGFLLHS